MPQNVLATETANEDVKGSSAGAILGSQERVRGIKAFIFGHSLSSLEVQIGPCFAVQSQHTAVRAGQLGLYKTFRRILPLRHWGHN